MSTNQNKYKNQSYFMSLALAHAKKNIGNTKENPSVGCVITKNNTVVSVGCTSFNGRPHAEYNALKNTKTNLKNSTMYVTLEPCSHHGKTPPCTDLIIKKKIRKVFFSVEDFDFRSRKKCKKILKNKNIITTKGVNLKKINKFYESYIKSKNSLYPFVTCKLAISKDYFMSNKNKIWITNYYSRSRGHLLRSSHDCLITSSKTINDDNPDLTCRIEGLHHTSPSRIILDNKLKIDLKSKILKKSNIYRTIIFYNKENLNKIKILNKLNVMTYKIPVNENNNLDLQQVLIKAKQLGFYRILIESGKDLSLSFLQDGLIDDLYLFISNKNLSKNGTNNIKKELISLIDNRQSQRESVYLFGEKLIRYEFR